MSSNDAKTIKKLELVRESLKSLKVQTHVKTAAALPPSTGVSAAAPAKAGGA